MNAQEEEGVKLLMWDVQGQEKPKEAVFQTPLEEAVLVLQMNVMNATKLSDALKVETKYLLRLKVLVLKHIFVHIVLRL
jgi:hypothetical protein